MKKDELIAANAELQSENLSLRAAEVRIREELSAALGAPQENDRYGSRKQKIYSWEQIFVEVGKLLERKKQTDIERKVFEIDFAVDGIQNQLDQMRGNPRSPDSVSSTPQL